MKNEPLRFDKICQKADIGGFIEACPIKSGGNNQVFKLNTIKGSFCLKNYFRSDTDKRDRLFSEFEFLKFAYEKEIHSVPRPFFTDKTSGLGIFEFIKGQKVKNAIPEHVDSAIDFAVELNTHRLSKDALALPVASEAAFSPQEQLAIVDSRLDKLKNVKNEPELQEFIKKQVEPLWEKTSRIVLREIAPLTDEDICVSPSDFGFHNTILDDNGKLFFVDFEYAGRDDPAKMICDFFSHPAVPVNKKYLERFIEALSPLFEIELKRRVEFLTPLFKIKWICIILNEFLREGAARRSFAKNSKLDIRTKKQQQLQMAKKYIIL